MSTTYGTSTSLIHRVAMATFLGAISSTTLADIRVEVDRDTIEVKEDTVQATLIWKNTWSESSRDLGVERSAFTYSVYSYFGEKLKSGTGEFELGAQEKMPLVVRFPKADWPRYRVDLTFNVSGFPRTVWRYIDTDGLGPGKEMRNNMAVIRGHYRWRWIDLNTNWHRTMRLGGQTHWPDENDPWAPVAGDPHFHHNRQADGPHHAWYRLRFGIPDELKSRRLVLLFDSVNYKAEVHLNGQELGQHTGTYESFRFDITNLVRLDGENELLVLVTDWTAMKKDFAYDRTPTKRYFKGKRYRPFLLTCDYSNRRREAGFLRWPLLLGLPDVRIENVVVRTSLTDKSITLLATLVNDTDQDIETIFDGQIFDAGKPLKSLGAKRTALSAGEVKMIEITEPWAKPKLWWPDRPHLYQLRTTLSRTDEEHADLFDSRFGFREFTTRGRHFLLNGQVCKPGHMSAGPNDFLDAFHQFGREGHRPSLRIIRSHRGGTRDPWDSKMDVMDESGMLVIREAFSAAGFGPMRRFAYGDDRFWENCRQYYEQFVARTVNRPSVVIYSLQNEAFRCGMAQAHPKAMPGFLALADHVRSIDPTRPIMFAGDGDPGGEDSPHLQIIDLHYPYPIPQANNFPADLRFLETEDPIKRIRSYPSSFKWTGKKPITMSETEFLGHLKHPGGLALVKGDSVYRSAYAWSKAFEFAQVLTYRIYRDAEVASICPWTHVDGTDEHALMPISVFIKDLTHNFYSGREVTRRLQIHHDLAFEGTETLLLRWKFSDNNTVIGEEERSLKLKPGERRYETIVLNLPEATQPRRLLLEVALLREGNQTPLHTDRQWLKVWPEVPLTIPDGLTIGLFDPIGWTRKQFEKLGWSFPSIESPKHVNQDQLRRFDVIIFGRDALTSSAIMDPGEFEVGWNLRTYMHDGGRVIVLQQPQEQTDDSMSLALNRVNEPQLEATKQPATLAFIADRHHPLLAELEDEDFTFWQTDHVVAKNTFQRPTQMSVAPLLFTGADTAQSPLIEVTAGRGKTLFSQLSLLDKIGVEPVADRMLARILEWAARPAEPLGQALLLDDPAQQLSRSLDRLTIQFKTPEQEVLSHHDLKNVPVVIASADSAQLAESQEAIARFVREGGKLWFCGLSPENRTALGAMLPHDLQMAKRAPGQLLKVAKDPLLAGISHADLWWFRQTELWPQGGNFDAGGELLQAILEYEVAPPRQFFFSDRNLKQPLSAHTQVKHDTSYDKVRGFGFVEPGAPYVPPHLPDAIHRQWYWREALRLGGVLPSTDKNSLIFQVNLPKARYDVTVKLTYPFNDGWRRRSFQQHPATLHKLMAEEDVVRQDIHLTYKNNVAVERFDVEVRDGALDLHFEFDAEHDPIALCTITIVDQRLLTNPGALMKIPFGSGFILVDQIRWQQPASGVAEQANRVARRLATNLGLGRTGDEP